MTGVQTCALPIFCYGLCLQGAGLSKLSTNLLPREILTQRLIREKKPWTAAAVGALLLACSFNFFFRYTTWYTVNEQRTIDNVTWKDAESGGGSVKSLSDSHLDKDKKMLAEMKLARAVGEEVAGNSDRRLAWMELLSAISAGLPPRSPGLDAGRIDDPTKVPFPQRQDLHIAYIESEYFPDVSTWFSDAVKQKYLEGEDQIKKFVKSGNVGTAAQAYIDTTNKGSQDLGFENYKDQTAAAENDFTKDEASQWNQYKDTSGVVAGIAPGVETAGLGGQTDIANLFEPTQAAADQTNTDQNAPKTGVSTDQQVALGKPFQYSAEELYQDTLPQDLAMAMSQRTPDVSEAPPLDLKTAQLDQTLPEEPDQIQQLLDSFRQQTAPSEGVQTAAYTMPGTVSDVGGGDIGVRSLISQQKGGTSAESDTLGLESIADRNLASAPSSTDLSAVTPGTATYSALTGADPTKTITSSVLGEDKGDIHGGIESPAVYRGSPDEFVLSDLLSSKYLSEKPDEKKALEDVGVIGGDATKTAT